MRAKSERSGCKYVKLASGLASRMTVNCEVHFPTKGVNPRLSFGSRRLHSWSLPATVEAIFNLGTLGRNDTSATPMSGLFRGGIP